MPINAHTSCHSTLQRAASGLTSDVKRYVAHAVAPENKGAKNTHVFRTLIGRPTHSDGKRSDQKVLGDSVHRTLKLSVEFCKQSMQQAYVSQMQKDKKEVWIRGLRTRSTGAVCG